MTACDLVRIAFDRLDAGDVEGRRGCHWRPSEIEPRER